MNKGWSERRKGKLWRWVTRIIGILVISFVLFRIYGRLLLNQEVGKLRSKGYPTTFEELETYNQLPKDVPNAADFYIDAMQAYQAPTEQEKEFIPYVGTFEIKNVEPFPSETIEAMVAIVERNSRTLNFLHRAGQREQCKFDYSCRDLSIFSNPYWDHIKPCFEILRLYSLYQAISGHYDLAFQGFVDMLRFGDSFSQELFVLSYSFRLTSHSKCMTSLRDILERATFSEIQMKALQDQLLHVRNGLRMDKVMIGERCLMVDQVHWIRSIGPILFPIRWIGLMDLNSVRLLEYYEQFETISMLQPEHRFVEYKRIKEQSDQLSSFMFITDMLASGLHYFGMLELRVIGKMDCARAALGVERFRMAEKRLPETLEELVPKFIEAVPIDPFDGKPLRYKRLEKGYMIYTIGEDGEDNGGAPKGKVEKGANYDWPFTVERE